MERLPPLMVMTIDDDDDDFWFGFEQEYFLWDVDNNYLRASLLVASPHPKALTTVLLARPTPLVVTALKSISTYV